MARLVGNVRCWVWWMGGFLCALLFGGPTQGCAPAAPEPVAAKPRPKPPGAAKEKPLTPKELVEDYLRPVAATEPSKEAGEKIEGLIRDFGSEEFKTRDAASRAILKHGPAALRALRKAKDSKDEEGANRARGAIAVIESRVRQTKARKIAELKGKAKSAAVQLVRGKYAEARKATGTAAQAVRAAEKSDKPGEIEKARAEQRAARRREVIAANLHRRIVPPAVAPPYGMLRRVAAGVPRGPSPSLARRGS